LAWNSRIARRYRFTDSSNDDDCALTKEAVVVDVVGATASVVAAGRAAGCVVVAIRAGNFGGWDQSGAHRVLDTLDELTPSLVEQLFADYGQG
jgi:phosphoglycolate phosphatase-like HAD superfamily hydrolase